MVQVQRGDDRQYFTNTAREYGDYSGAVSTAINTVDSISKQANQTKLANYQVDLSARFMKKNQEINTKYQTEPDNPERDKELKSAFDNLVAEYKVSPFVQKQWKETQNKIFNNYKTYNAEWAIKQNVSNAQSNLKNGLENINKQVGMMAMQGADDNLVKLTYSNGLDALRKGSIGILGEVYVNDFLKSATHDIAVSYMDGLIQTNPAKAVQMLNTKNIYDKLRKFKQGIKPSDYDTKLTKDEEQKFQAWAKKAKETGVINPNDNFQDYDMRGFWKNEVLQHTELASGNAEAHFTDKYKKPNHESFSTESMYATGDNAKYAGTWDENGDFIPPILDDSNSIINDIGDVQSINKLQTMARNQMIKQNEINAVERVAQYINKNHQIYNKALNGTLTTVEAQNFLSDKNVDRRMRGVLADMLGYSSHQDLYVEAETGKIKSQEAERKKRETKNGISGSELASNFNFANLVIGDKSWHFLDKKGNIRKANDFEKSEITSALYIEGSRLLNGIGGKTPSAQIKDIAGFASKLAQASYFGMNKGDYDKLMNKFVLPATVDIQEQAKKYNANISGWNPKSGKYGYEQIENYFKKNFKNPKSEAVQKEKALASIYYWSSLNNYCSQKGISMNQLFGLSREVRAGIYNKAASDAIKKARATSSAPQLWFRSANPQYVAIIRGLMPTNTDADEVITNVAVACMSNPDMSDKDVQSVINREISKKYSAMRMERSQIVFGAKKTKYDEIINLYSSQYGVDPLLVKAVIQQESGFNQNAVSKSGAIGLMQLMPATARGLGVKNAYDPKQNILAGTKYLGGLIRQFNGNIPLALAAYNAGPGNVIKSGNKIPKNGETPNYVRNVMANYKKYRG